MSGLFSCFRLSGLRFRLFSHFCFLYLSDVCTYVFGAFPYLCSFYENPSDVIAYVLEGLCMWHFPHSLFHMTWLRAPMCSLKVFYNSGMCIFFSALDPLLGSPGLSAGFW